MNAGVSVMLSKAGLEVRIIARGMKNPQRKEESDAEGGQCREIGERPKTGGGCTVVVAPRAMAVLP